MMMMMQLPGAVAETNHAAPEMKAGASAHFIQAYVHYSNIK